MVKEPIKYIDFLGNERNETFYFHLTEAELMEMEMGTTGGYTAWINEIIEAQDTPTLINIFKDVILKSIGKKTADGRGFTKSQAIRDEFACTQAYSVLFMKLATNTEEAERFMNGIIEPVKKNLSVVPETQGN